jgi:hypothetical protein
LMPTPNAFSSLTASHMRTAQPTRCSVNAAVSPAMPAPTMSACGVAMAIPWNVA